MASPYPHSGTRRSRRTAGGGGRVASVATAAVAPTPTGRRLLDQAHFEASFCMVDQENRGGIESRWKLHPVHAMLPPTGDEHGVLLQGLCGRREGSHSADCADRGSGRRQCSYAHGQCAPLEIDVFDQSRHPPAEPGDHFVRWPAYLEIEASTVDVAAEAFVSTLARLLNGLRTRGLRVVAACDFEDTLAAALQVAGT
jgi:hypothetical protein